MLSLIFATLLLTPESTPYRFNISTVVAEDAIILIEMPVTGKFKKITLDQFRKHVKLLTYLEYELKDVKIKGLTIQKAVFVLPTLKEEKRHDAKQSIPDACFCG